LSLSVSMSFSMSTASWLFISNMAIILSIPKVRWGCGEN
jgi:hypothetical protein